MRFIYKITFRPLGIYETLSNGLLLDKYIKEFVERGYNLDDIEITLDYI